MARYKNYESGQGLFLTLQPAEQFDDYSLEKTIERFVESEVNLSKFSEMYKNTSRGQAAYNPKPLLKVLFFAFAKGTATSRKIEDLLDKHISYIYLSGNQRFDHSTICRFINLHSENIKECFSKLLSVLNELNLIDWSSIEIDGTIVEANASKKMTGKSSDFEKLMERCQRYSEKLTERAKYLSSDEFSEEFKKDEERKIQRQKNIYQNTIKKIEKYQEEVQDGKRDSNLKTNLTDEDSSLLKRRENKGYSQGYNFQCSFSTNDILLDNETAFNGSDSLELEKRMNKLKELKKTLEVQEESHFLMDKGFFNSEKLSKLLAQGDDIYIPIPDYIKDRPLVFKGDDVYMEYEGTLLKGNFKKSGNTYVFPYKDKTNKKRKFTVKAPFVENKTLWDAYRRKMNSKGGKFIYAKRIGKEHNHHTLKEIGSMRRIYRRGCAKVNLEGLLHGIGYNLKKLNKYIMHSDLSWAA